MVCETAIHSLYFELCWRNKILHELVNDFPPDPWENVYTNTAAVAQTLLKK